MQGHYQDEETPVLIKPIDYVLRLAKENDERFLLLYRMCTLCAVKKKKSLTTFVGEI